MAFLDFKNMSETEFYRYSCYGLIAFIITLTPFLSFNNNSIDGECRNEEDIKSEDEGII